MRNSINENLQEPSNPHTTTRESILYKRLSLNNSITYQIPDDNTKVVKARKNRKKNAVNFRDAMEIHSQGTFACHFTYRIFTHKAYISPHLVFHLRHN